MNKSEAIEICPECPETLSQAQVEAYWERGCLAFEGVLSEEETRRARDDLRALLVDLLQASEEASPAEGAGKGVYSGAALKRKDCRAWIQFERGALEGGLDPAQADAIVAEKVRKFADYDDESALFQSLRDTHPRIHGILRSLIGGSASLYQSMALVKPARIGSSKRWHQDNAYFSVADLDKVVGVWIALDEATPENGCMFVIEGGHRAGPLKHVMGEDCELAPGRIDKSLAKAVPLKPGGALFFHGNLPHFTPPNRSSRARRALQYHFRAAENAVIDKDAYLDIFRETDGTPATCHAARQETI